MIHHIPKNQKLSANIWRITHLGGALVGSILQANHTLASFQYLKHQFVWGRWKIMFGTWLSLLLRNDLQEDEEWKMTSSSNWRLFSVACFTPNPGPSQPFFWVWNIISIRFWTYVPLILVNWILCGYWISNACSYYWGLSMSKTRAWSAFGQIYASRWLISILQISRLLQVWYMDIWMQSGGKKKDMLTMPPRL